MTRSKRLLSSVAMILGLALGCAGVSSPLQSQRPPENAVDRANQAAARSAAEQGGPPGSSGFAARFRDAIVEAYEGRQPLRNPAIALPPDNAVDLLRIRQALYSDRMLLDPRLERSIADMINRVQSWEGRPVPNGTFREVVGLRSRDRRHKCSGTLIASDTVLTAAHCQCEGANEVVVFGNSFDDPNAENVPSMGPVMMARSCDAAAVKQDDVAIVRIPSRSDIPVAVLAQMAWVPSSGSLTVVGFGETRQGSTGIKLAADVPIVSTSCSAPADPSMYGCTRDREIVTGDYLRTGRTGADPCDGDSGGPLFVTHADGKLYVTSTVARGVEPPGGCGYGSTYQRLDQRRTQWLTEQRVRFQTGR